MFDAKDLRIGNLYYLGLSGTKDIQEFNNWTQALDFEAYGYPIELTEEIMRDLGFVGKYKSCGYEFKKDILNLSSQDEDDYGNSIDNYVLHFYHNHQGAAIYYVHQLQNLYFALTGEELNTSKLF